MYTLADTLVRVVAKTHGDTLVDMENEALI